MSNELITTCKQLKEYLRCNNVIIGAGAVITKDIPDNCVVEAYLQIS